MEVLRAYPRHQAYFWATHAGAELDLLLVRGEERLDIAIEDLNLNRHTVIHAGEATFPLAENITAQSLTGFSKSLAGHVHT